jgi:hypothetical protein
MLSFSRRQRRHLTGSAVCPSFPLVGSPVYGLEKRQHNAQCLRLICIISCHLEMLPLVLSPQFWGGGNQLFGLVNCHMCRSVLTVGMTTSRSHT